MAKYAAIAYALWFVGSWLGLHHLYLHRPRAAFVNVVTLNGWGVAWLLDCLSIPLLVAQANEDAEYREKLRVEKKFHSRPPLSLLGSLVQIFTGTQFGALAACLLPKGLPGVLYEVLFAVGAAHGITFTGDAIDPQTKGSFSWVVISVATVLLPACVFYGFDHEDENYRSTKVASIFIGAFIYLQTRRWSDPVSDSEAASEGDSVGPGFSRATPLIEKKRLKYWKTLLKFWSMLGVFVACCLTALTFHGQVRIEINGEITETPFFEACNNFVHSEAFQTFTSTMYDLYQGKSYDQHFHERWESFNANLDLSGRFRHLKTLGLAKDASDKDVKAAYRRLVLHWHPDKYTGDDKDGANAKFFEIQEAYEKLMGDTAKPSSDRARAGWNDEL